MTAADHFGVAVLFNGETETTSLDLLPKKEAGDMSALKLDASQLRQIRVDLARTRPDGFSELFMDRRFQFVMTRLLYIWGIKNPASGYVQGINDIMSPLFIVFLLGEMGIESEEMLQEVLQNTEARIPESAALAAEADTFLALQIVLSEIQDYFVPGRPGISNFLLLLEQLVHRVNPRLSAHFAEQEICISQFAVRWINCLLAREFSSKNTIVLWDAFLAEGVGQIRSVALFMSLALLMRFAPELMGMNFEKGIIYLQKPLSLNWTEEDVRTLIAEAFIWRSLYADSPSQRKPT